MKIITQLLLIFLPFYINAQDIRDHFKFIEEFATYHSHLTSNENGDWSEYDNKKGKFDLKLNNLITQKKLIFVTFNTYLAEQEEVKLNQILSKYSKTNSSDVNLRNELLNWRMNPIIYIRQDAFYELFDKLDNLKEESNAVNSDSEDPLSVLLLVSRLEEVVELIEKLS